jgi:hypothetical protein
MQPIQVVAHIDAQGQIWPRSFVFQGRNISVDSIGRQWQARDGQHTLVMDRNRQTYHLIYQSDCGEWYLFPMGHPPPMSQA